MRQYTERISVDIVRIDIKSSRRTSPAKETEVLDGIKIVHHDLHHNHTVHVAVIDFSPEERTAWRLIDPEVKKKFTDELALFGSSLRFTGTGLRLIAPEGAFSQLNPIENCQASLKELGVMIDAYRL